MKVYIKMSSYEYGFIVISHLCSYCCFWFAGRSYPNFVSLIWRLGSSYKCRIIVNADNFCFKFYPAGYIELYQ